MAHKKDPRFVYGVGCTWFGPVQAVGSTPPATMQINGKTVQTHGLPCCPHCRGLLLESPTAKEWWDLAKAYEADGHPGYIKMLQWAQGKCFKTTDDMRTAYERATTNG